MLYLDYAATSFPKPKEVYKAVERVMRRKGANAGRSGHRLSLEAARGIFEAREQAAELFHISDPERICFTKNTTEALNLAILGFLNEGDHVVLGGMEHNSVLRPVHALAERGKITYTVAPADGRGVITLQGVEACFQKNTKLLVLNHASNVCGSVAPLREIADLAKKRGIALLLDSAQTAGVLPIDLSKTPVSMLAFAGHKGLYGPQGTGGLYVAPSVSLTPLMTGGTGSESESFGQPTLLPDRFESGTMNAPALAGLAAGIRFVRREGVEEIGAWEQQWNRWLREELANIPNVTVYGGGVPSVGVTAFLVKGWDSISFCRLLEEEDDIAARGGLHCAPLAHRALGTLQTGLCRFSLGAFTTKRQLERAVTAVKKAAKKRME